MNTPRVRRKETMSLHFSLNNSIWLTLFDCSLDEAAFPPGEEYFEGEAVVCSFLCAHCLSETSVTD